MSIWRRDVETMSFDEARSIPFPDNVEIESCELWSPPAGSTWDQIQTDTVDQVAIGLDAQPGESLLAKVADLDIPPLTAAAQKALDEVPVDESAVLKLQAEFA